MRSTVRKVLAATGTLALSISLAGLAGPVSPAAAAETKFDVAGYSKVNRYIVTADAAVQRVLEARYGSAAHVLVGKHMFVNAPRADIRALISAAGVNLGTVRIRPDAWIDTPRAGLEGRSAAVQMTAEKLAAADAAGIGAVRPTGMWYPDDPYYQYQWDMWHNSYYNGIDLESQWNQWFNDDPAEVGDGVTVAILDTGITEHPDLVSAGGYDFISDLGTSNDGDLRDSDPSDPGDWTGDPLDPDNFSSSSWHGTHVHGTIAAQMDNGMGVVGIAPAADILDIRVLGKGGGWTSDIVDGLMWAAGLSVDGVDDNPTPAKVANLSLGGPGSCDSESLWQDAIWATREAGMLTVVSAGNDGSLAGAKTPASCQGVITVAASGPTGNRSWYSNFDVNVDVTAPGGDDFDYAFARSDVYYYNMILSTWNNGETSPGDATYGFMEGTSMAAPHVTGIVALIYSVNPDLTPDQARAALTGINVPFGTYGAGYFAEIKGLLDYDGLPYSVVWPWANGDTDDYFTCELADHLCTHGLVDADATILGSQAETGMEDWLKAQAVEVKTVRNDNRTYDVELSWTDGSPVDGFKVKASNGQSCASRLVVKSSSYTCRINKLKIGTSYSATISSTVGRNTVAMNTVNLPFFALPYSAPKVTLANGSMYPGWLLVKWSQVAAPDLTEGHADPVLYMAEVYSKYWGESWGICDGYGIGCASPYVEGGDSYKVRVWAFSSRGEVLGNYYSRWVTVSQPLK